VSLEVGLATCAALSSLAPDDQLLLPALERHGVRARACVWNDAGVDWDSLSAVVVRSTWDYHRHRDAYLAWAERLASFLPVWNPLETLRWNSHKSYLSRMGSAGIPVVPTETGRAGETLEALAARRGWSDVVVKPAVSAGAESVLHVRAGEYARAEGSYRQALSTGEQLVQPYVTEIDDAGEHSLVYFNGVYSHAVRRPPGLVARQPGAPAATRLEAASAEREVAERALRFAGPSPLYARADLVPLRSGSPVLMELELIEPALFLGSDPEAPERFVQAILARVG
jgi:hypothetical protein